MKTVYWLACLALAAGPACAQTAPDCTGTGAWPNMMTAATLKNAGMANAQAFDLSKTEIVRLSSQSMGFNTSLKSTVFRQVYNLRLHGKAGESLEAIVISDATQEECSAGDIDVFVVSRHLTSGNKSPMSLLRPAK